MISNYSNYFALIAPVSTIFLGLILIGCWFFLRKNTFLVWIGAAYIIPSFALAAQNLMSHEELARWSAVCGIVYLIGFWCLAQGMAKRCGSNAAAIPALTISVICTALLGYYSFVQDELWMRALTLNTAMLLLQTLPLSRIIASYNGSNIWDRLVCWSYALCMLITLTRVLMIIMLISTGSDIGQLTQSGYWKLMLATSLLFNLWFIVTILASTVHEIVSRLHDERDQDPLTRLFNRRAFFERADNCFVSRLRVPCALIACDIDNFKSVNDTWGHDAGDAIIKGVANILQANIRKGDIAARFGGEEFIVLLKDVDTETAKAIAERIRMQLSETSFPEVPRHITASFGVAPVATARDIPHAIREADMSLYKAKQSGRDRVCLAMAS